MTNSLQEVSERAASCGLVSAFVARGDSTAVRAALRVGAVLFVAALTGAAAQISAPLPFTPVPFTLQPMVVLLGGAALGSRRGFTSQILYLAAGVAGLPVFAASAVLPQGALRLIGPTGGYLICYPLAACLTGYLAERGLDRRYWTSAMSMALGLALIYAGGVLWLATNAFIPATGPLGAAAALHGGFYPFVAADICKVLAAAALLPRIRRLFGLRTPRRLSS